MEYGCKSFLDELRKLKSDDFRDKSKTTTIELEVSGVKVKITVG